MAFKYHFRDDTGDLVEFTSRVQLGFSARPGTDGLVMNAEEGSVGVSQIRVEDPDGNWDFPRGHRLVIVTEDECAGDDYGTAVFIGFTATRRFERDLMRAGAAARVITVDLVDINSYFERRIMVGSDSNRDEETDVERITWLMSTTEAGAIDDFLYFSTDDPVNMDAVDYRGQGFRQVLDDCSLQSGKNWFLWRHDQSLSLWYGPRGTTDFSSAIRISNVLADVDNVVTFAPAITSTLTRDPSRVYSGIYRAYASSYLYTQSESTAVTFARRDTFESSPNVKTKLKALVRNERELADISTEEDVISTAIIVPRAQANDVVAGQRIQIKYSHFPDYADDFVWMRVLNRTVREVGKDQIELALELTRDEPAADTSGVGAVFGILARAAAYDAYEDVWFDWVGDNPDTGGAVQPTVGLITPLYDTNGPLAPTWIYYGFEIDGTGTIDVTFYTSTIGITPTGVTFSIRKNGVDVASVYQANTGNGNDGYVSIEGLAVVPGDVITAGVVATPQGVPFFRAPRGTGDNAEALTITGGTVT